MLKFHEYFDTNLTKDWIVSYNDFKHYHDLDYIVNLNAEVSPEVYFIRAGNSNKFKIGLSSSPLERLKALSVGNPEQLHLYGLMTHQDPEGLEKTLHSFYDEKRLNGEWFELSDEDFIVLPYLMYMHYKTGVRFYYVEVCKVLLTTLLFIHGDKVLDAFFNTLNINSAVITTHTIIDIIKKEYRKMENNTKPLSKGERILLEQTTIDLNRANEELVKLRSENAMLLEENRTLKSALEVDDCLNFITENGLKEVFEVWKK